MGYGFAVLMFALAAGIILFALLMPGSLDLLWHAQFKHIKKNKPYVKALKKVLCFVALAPVASGLISLILTEAGVDMEGTAFFIPFIVLIAGLILNIRYGCRRWMKEFYESE